jgi:hypothetical protein
MLEALLEDRAGATDSARELFARSIAGDDEAGAAVLADQTRYHQAGFLARNGAPAEARAQFGELEQRFAKRGMPIWQRLCSRAANQLN